MDNQRIFNFKVKKNYKDGDFFVSKSNKIVHKAIINDNNIAEKLFILKDLSKSGKTHLGKLWKKIIMLFI